MLSSQLIDIDPRTRVKNLAKSLLANSTAQAILTLFNTKHISLKLFLLVCLLFSSGFCSYTVIKAILNFVSFPVITTTRMFYENPAVFPKITVCNVNPFTSVHAIGFIKEINRLFYPQIDIFDQGMFFLYYCYLPFNGHPLIFQILSYYKLKKSYLNKYKCMSFARIRN